ncbi:ATP-binding protein [Photobacterium sp. Hal280]|uniref:ATP-binding protein n=1 Tax=Photobacterium sp. Hal280 TaxID=3035163 RepID=UPI00301B820F
MGNIPGFRIAARALRQLGAELITSDEIALNELIKNALDAKSKQVHINITNPFKVSRDEFTSSLGGMSKAEFINKLKSNFIDGFELDDKLIEVDNLLNVDDSNDFVEISHTIYDEMVSIIIEDNGSGMDANKLQNSFLVIGTPTKWIEKQSDTNGEILGEKGVGRLSMMRLGRYAKVISSKENEEFENEVTFDWKKFDDPSLYLDDIEVSVDIGEKKEISAHGTKIIVKGVYAHWDEDKVSDFIHSYIRRLQNPFAKKIDSQY